jgi:hypothetical protein
VARIYLKKELKAKMGTLLEYYKYHKNIPRMFMPKIYKVINRFHERKRRIDYATIKRKLGIKEEVSEKD